MRFPTRGANASVAFAPSYDVQVVDGQYRLADTHLRTGLKQFCEPVLEGYAAVLTSRIAQRLVIVGGYEERYAGNGIIRPVVIHNVLKEHYGVDASKMEAVRSEPNTIGNAEAIAKWCHEHQYSHDDAFIVCAYWHAARAAVDFRIQGLEGMAVIPAEAVWLAESLNETTRQHRRNRLAIYWGRGDFVERAAMECNGIADKLCRAYQPFSERPEKPLVAAE